MDDKWHRLTAVDVVARTAFCSICGPTKIKLKGKYGRSCWTAVYAGIKRRRASSLAYRDEKRRAREKERLLGKRKSKDPHRKWAKPVCERCGFVAVHICQIDVHHKDRNHKNNNPDNLENLCALCHRLEHLPEDVKISLGIRNNQTNG